MADQAIWEVVGGTTTGGILVREEKDVKSKETSERLATGSLVKQLELDGDRLRFLRQTGAGPNVGWVSLKLKTKSLVEKSDKVLPAVPLLVCFYSGGFTAPQGVVRLTPFMAVAQEAGFPDILILDHVGEPGYDDCKDWDDYVARLAAKVDEDPRHRGRPVVIFAHSHGTTPAWGLARYLGDRVLKFYCCCKRPPNQGLIDEVFGVDCAAAAASLDTDFIFAKLIDAWPNPFMEQWRTIRPLPQMIIDAIDVVRRQYFSPIMPCGSAECKRICGDGDKIPAPILCFAATQEEDMGERADKMAGWRELTTGGFDLRMLEGTHMGLVDIRSPLYPAVLVDLQALVQARAVAAARPAEAG